MSDSVQFIESFTSEGEFTMLGIDEFLSRVNTKKPIVAVSVVGKFRIGKSHLINKLFFNKKVFEVSNESKPCTKGAYVAINSNHKDYDLLIIDTEGYESLLSTDDVPLATGQNVSKYFDLLEDRVRSMLGIIITMSDIVLHVVKSNAIDKTEFTYIEYEAMKLRNLYHPHLMEELATYRDYKVSTDESKIYSALTATPGPKLVICHRYNSREVKQFDGNRIGSLVQYLRFLISPEQKGAFSELQIQKLDENEPLRDYNELKDLVGSYLKKIPVTIAPKPIAIWYTILSNMMLKMCKNPPPVSSILREFVRTEIKLCDQKCVSCGQRCENYALHSRYKCFSLRECCKSKEYKNWNYVHKQCPNSPKNGFSLLIKKISYSPASVIFGNYWNCENCKEYEEYEYILEGPQRRANQELVTSKQEVFFHCYPCNQAIWNPGKDSYVCQHSTKRCDAQSQFNMDSGSINLTSKM
jgi:GTP-binding protein EngB required for normal cell division